LIKECLLLVLEDYPPIGESITPLGVVHKTPDTGMDLLFVEFIHGSQEFHALGKKLVKIVWNVVNPELPNQFHSFKDTMINKV
jgi:hypothetical protein